MKLKELRTFLLDEQFIKIYGTGQIEEEGQKCEEFYTYYEGLAGACPTRLDDILQINFLSSANDTFEIFAKMCTEN